MSNNRTSVFNDFFGNKFYFLFANIAAIPVYFAANAYARNARIQEDEAVSFSTSVIFVLGIFAGRYIAQLRTSRRNPPGNFILIALALLITGCISWIFFYAEFPFRDRSSINLLLFWMPFLVASLAMGALIKLVRSVTTKQLEEAQRFAAHSQSELNALQSQLSPHFLFNTLNNIYGLSITDHEKIPPLLLKLSELLRYSVYQATDMFVPLKDEVDYISNYIEFEKLRIGDKLVLTSNMEINTPHNVRIAPMLLIVFIENAFKHSKNTAGERIYIDIQLKTWENSILFTVKNSVERVESDHENKFGKNSGYGLANVRKRLDLLYPKEYMLEILEEERSYKATLQLKMK